MEMQEQKFGITAHEVEIIGAIIEAFPKYTFSALIGVVKRQFKEDTKPEHFAALGYFVGYLNATENAFDHFYKNSLPCQRQN